MDIIDSHLHFANREGFKETAKQIGQLNYSAYGLKKEFEETNIIAGVVMTIPDKERSYELILDDGTLDCLFSCIGVNPELIINDSRYVDEIEKEIDKSNVTGIKLYPGYFPYYVYDSIYDPIYELAKKYNLPVAIHCGDTQSSDGLLKYSHPLTIDELAVKHKENKFIICHMGIPWIMDTAELISKNPNVYTDLSGLIAGNEKQVNEKKNTRLYCEYIQQGLIYAERYDKVLFGSDWPLVPIRPYIDFIKHIVPKAYHEKVFYKNAIEVYPKLKELLV